MKALTYVSPGKIVFNDAAMPVLKPGEALIRVRKAGICGTDAAIVHGAHPRAVPPLIPGHEFVGVIADMPGAPAGISFSIGDRVAVFPLLFCGKCRACASGVPHVCSTLKLIGIDRDGGFAEFAAVPLHALVKLPDALDDNKGVLLEPLAVGLHAVEMASPAPGDRIVVVGAGPIGLVTAYSLLYSGFTGILVSDVNPQRLKRAQRLGLDTVNADRVLDAVQGATAGEGADIVFECAGAPPAALIIPALLRPRGKAVIVSVHKKNPPVDLRSVNFKEITLVGARVYSRANFESALDALSRLDEKIMISHAFDISEGARAFEVFENPALDTCKVVISMGDQH